MQLSRLASWRKLIAPTFVPVKENDWLGLMSCGAVRCVILLYELYGENQTYKGSQLINACIRYVYYPGSSS